MRGLVYSSLSCTIIRCACNESFSIFPLCPFLYLRIACVYVRQTSATLDLNGKCLCLFIPNEISNIILWALPSFHFFFSLALVLTCLFHIRFSSRFFWTEILDKGTFIRPFRMHRYIILLPCSFNNNFFVIVMVLMLKWCPIINQWRWVARGCVLLLLFPCFFFIFGRFLCVCKFLFLFFWKHF